MVGLKSIWLLFILVLFAACVPQSKQTECGSNEAFNAQLRSCVPIVQGPAAFINISSYSPLYTATRYKNDTTPVTFTILVSNPYNQSYTIEWDLNYNGVIDTIAGNVTTASIIPALYSNQIGSNVITAKIISGGTVVDSHNFEVMIQDSPKPNINTATVFPADYNPELFPDNTGQRFSFTERNNGASALSNYRVFWTLSKNGVNQTSFAETDTFTDTTTNGSNVIYYGTSTVPRFDPSTLGVGSYVLRARIENPVAGEVVAEQQWNIVVKDPDIGFVSTAGSPLPSQDTVAFFGVSYGTYAMKNSAATQSRFCVTVSDPDGSYTNGSSSDPTNLNIVVRFYKDGAGSPLYEGKTDGSASPVVDTVCFDNATLAEKGTLVYNDGSPVLSQYRSITARVFDEQTGKELCQTGTATCPIPYPVSWKVLVKPLDTGVTAAFQNAIAADNITYTSTGTSTRTANVTQNQAVTVRFLPSDGIVGYEGYDMSQTGAANSSHFLYQVVVKKAGVTIDTFDCKDTTDPFPFVGVTSVQSCTFNWPAFDPGTGAHLAPGTYTATLQVTDDGSPVPGSIGTVATALTINATVSEPVNAPTFAVAPDFLDMSNAIIVPPVNEGTTMKFRVQVSELEHDNYTLRVEACGTAAACPTTTLIASDSRIFGDPLYTTNTAVTYTIPEDVLGATLNGNVYFKITLTDAPVNSAKSSSTTTIVSLNTNNFNVVPAFTIAAALPVNTATYNVFSGNQFTISATSAITDASTPATEQANTFQWWIGSVNDTTSTVGWTAIDGAISKILRWTPGPELTALRYITVCYSDGYPRTTANATNPPGTAGVLCSASTWTVQPRSSALGMTTPAAPNGEVAVHHVPAESIAYLAYADDDKIYIEKANYNADGTMAKPMRVVSFNALVSGTAMMVKNLSIAASDSSLYVSYLADSATTPNSFRAHIRRINISNAAAQGGEKTNAAFNANTGTKRKFDFNYTGYSVITNCTGSATNCAWDNTVKSMTFDGTALNLADTITIRQIIGGVNVDTVLTMTASPYTTGTVCANCNANEQAESFSIAINNSASTGIQGLTAFNSASPVTFVNGMGTAATEIYTSTEAMTAMGRILYHDTLDRWYLPVANADLAGAQNKIQILHGPDDDVSLASMVTNNKLTTLDFVSAIDNVWSADAPKQLYLGYLKLSGSVGKITKVAPSGNDFSSIGTTRTIVSAATALQSINIAGPIGTENPYVYAASQDSADNYWVTRLPADLSTQTSSQVENIYADATDATILTDANISTIHIEAAKALAPATVTSEARVTVVSNNGTANYNAYLFRMKTVAGADVLDSTTTFDQDSKPVSATTKIAAFAPTIITLGDAGATTTEKTNAMMGVLRVRNDGEVEFSLLNTEVESINSTTNSPTGEFRAPLVK